MPMKEQAQAQDRSARTDRLLILFLTLLSTLPLIYPRVAPLVDLPAHIGRFAVAQNQNDPFLSSFYLFQWRPIGNIGLDFPVLLLAKLVGVEAATKLLVISIPALMTLGVLLTYRRLHGNISPYAVLAACLVYSMPFHWGFVNFWFGIAVGWLFAWIDLRGQRGSRADAAMLAVFGTALWLAHALAWAVMAAIIFALRVGRSEQLSIASTLRTALRFLPFLAVPVMMQVYWLTALGASGEMEGFFLLYYKAASLAHVFTYSSRLQGFAMAAALAAVAGLSALTWGLRFNRGMAIASVLLGVIFLAMPTVVMQSWGADLRIGPVLLMSCVMAAAPKKEASLALPLTLFVAFVGIFTWSYARASQRVENFVETLAPVERKTRLAHIYADPCDPEEHELIPVTSHAPRLLIERKRVFVPHWNFPQMNLMQVRYPQGRGYEDATFAVGWPPSCPGSGPSLETVIGNLPAGAFDYLVVSGALPEAIDLPRRFQPLGRNEDAALYRIHDAPALR